MGPVSFVEEQHADTPDEFAKIIRAEAQKWDALGKKLGVTLD